MKTRLALMVFVGLILTGGCSSKDTVTDGDRSLSHQNVGAARVILGQTTEPGIVAPAKDIEANSEQQLRGWGLPVTPKPYSTEVSVAARKKTEEEHATPWWQVILAGAGTFLLGVLGRGGIGTLLATVAPRFAAGPLGAAAVSLVEGIARVREDIKSRPDGQKSISELDLLEILGEAQKDPKIKELIRTLAHKAEEKLALHL